MASNDLHCAGLRPDTKVKIEMKAYKKPSEVVMANEDEERGMRIDSRDRVQQNGGQTVLFVSKQK